MSPKRDAVKCNWCSEMLPVPQVIVEESRNSYGSVVERRCPKCGGVLAAYLKDEGEFLTKMRTF